MWVVRGVWSASVLGVGRRDGSSPGVGVLCSVVALSAGPVTFLVGAERSGTTLLRIMLDRHPDVAFWREFEFAIDLVGDDGSLPEMDRYLDFLSEHRDFAVSGFEVDASLGYAGLVRGFLEQKRRRDGKSLVGATVHRGFGRLLALWPDARFVHLVRDGRDVARSSVRMGWAGNSWAAASAWVGVERELDALWDRVGVSRVVHVRFEALVCDPASELERICRFLGVSYDEGMLRVQDGSTYGPPDPAAASSWRRGASEMEIRRLESVQGEMLERRGYALSGYGSHRAGMCERLLLRLHSRWGRVRFRVRRFGLWVCVCETMGRRLGLEGVRRRAQLRINEMQRGYLR